MINTRLRLQVYHCHNKRGYETEAVALEVADNVYRKYGPLLRAYKCPICNEWHLTSKGERNGRR